VIVPQIKGSTLFDLADACQIQSDLRIAKSKICEVFFITLEHPFLKHFFKKFRESKPKVNALNI
jgi:hypothetical protein